MGVIENSYSTVLKGVFKAINPIKKRIIKTECIVHKFINNQSIEILKNDGYNEAGNYLESFINDINSGAVWADQDFKSSNHFYNPGKEKGLYGRSNAKAECMLYYTKALKYYYDGDINLSMFYLGASCHLVQDMSVPQHVNRKLLSHHRKYEQWVIKVYNQYDIFKVDRDGIYLDSIDGFIKYNTQKAYEAYMEYLHEDNIYERFYKTTQITLTTAQRTTAGVMLKFFNDINGLITDIYNSEKSDK